MSDCTIRVLSYRDKIEFYRQLDDQKRSYTINICKIDKNKNVALLLRENSAKASEKKASKFRGVWYIWVKINSIKILWVLREATNILVSKDMKLLLKLHDKLNH